MLYSCTHIATVGIRGLTDVSIIPLLNVLFWWMYAHLLLLEQILIAFMALCTYPFIHLTNGNPLRQFHSLVSVHIVLCVVCSLCCCSDMAMHHILTSIFCSEVWDWVGMLCCVNISVLNGCVHVFADFWSMPTRLSLVSKQTESGVADRLLHLFRNVTAHAYSTSFSFRLIGLVLSGFLQARLGFSESQGFGINGAYVSRGHSVWLTGKQRQSSEGKWQVPATSVQVDDGNFNNNKWVLVLNFDLTEWQSLSVTILSWLLKLSMVNPLTPLLPHGYSYKASCARPG